jgi:hypothetical protein
MTRVNACALAVCAALVLALPASAQRVKCKLEYDLTGWSMLYRFGEGSGRITCTNGQVASVSIRSHGGGPSFGGQKVIDGTGNFTSVHAIEDLYGTYFDVGAHAGAGRSVDARVMLKGSGNLALSGTGLGINLGFTFGGFTIRPR